MARYFALHIHLYESRYHGSDEWPPSPSRVFQALVAGSAQGGRVPEGASQAIEFLEKLAPPLIAAPVARLGQRVSQFVPNNDLDAVGGDPDRIGDVRVKKQVQPRLLEGDASILYAWSLPETGGEELVSLADGLYQFGRGVDPAWALGELLDDEQIASRLRAHRGTIHRPSGGDGSIQLAVPTRNSFQSVVQRFEATLVRLKTGTDGKASFRQPPKAHFVMASYDGTPQHHLFELCHESNPSKSAPWPMSSATSLIVHIRDVAVASLSEALPARIGDIERVLVGRKSDGTKAGSIEERVRFIPLPSIGHKHADQSIRRVLVYIPPGPLAEEDVLWALAGRPIFDPKTGELTDTTLAAAPVDEMVQRYSAPSRVWRSVTPLALGSASRRRIEPSCQREEAKPAREREAEEVLARHAVVQSLRHAKIEGALVRVHVQREPFEAHGVRAERFAEGTRFSKETLWHVELEIDREIRGPLVLGDGRFLGLGVMAPQSESGVFSLNIEGGLPSNADATLLARALRRAVLARVQAVLGVRGEKVMSSYFHGHAANGEPSREDSSRHLAFSVDAQGSRLLIVPPHVLDGWTRPFPDDAKYIRTLEQALDGFTTLRAGSAGVLSLQVSRLSPSDPLCHFGQIFRSISDYAVCRHSKGASAEEAVVTDVRRECERRHLPRPEAVRVASVRGVEGVGVLARVEIVFAVAVHGPILLGRTRFLGGGLFRPIKELDQP
jgi:CRISPR-associated protein Csb2